MTAVLILVVKIGWSISITQTYFSTFAACESVLPAVIAQVASTGPAKVSAVCYEEAKN